MARPLIQLDEIKIKKLAQIHCTNEEIAHIMCCSKDTLTRRFASVIAEGKSEGKMSLRRSIWKAAQAEQPWAIKFLCKNLLGMSENPENIDEDEDKTLYVEFNSKIG